MLDPAKIQPQVRLWIGQLKEIQDEKFTLVFPLAKGEEREGLDLIRALLAASGQIDRVILTTEGGVVDPQIVLALKEGHLIYTVVKHLATASSRIAALAGNSRIPILSKGRLAEVPPSAAFFGMGVERGGVDDPLLSVPEAILQVTAALLLAARLSQKTGEGKPEDLEAIRQELSRRLALSENVLKFERSPGGALTVSIVRSELRSYLLAIQETAAVGRAA